MFFKISHKHPNEHRHEDLGNIRIEFQRKVVETIKIKQARDATQRLRHKLERWRNCPLNIIFKQIGCLFANAKSVPACITARVRRISDQMVEVLLMCALRNVREVRLPI